jgi:hypothetical protein
MTITQFNVLLAAKTINADLYTSIAIVYRFSKTIHTQFSLAYEQIIRQKAV